MERFLVNFVVQKKIMKNSLLAVLFLTLTIAQSQDKVKGNREPSTIITTLADFENIEIGNDYEISIVKGIAPQIEVTTDSNLHQYIVPVITEGVLSINTTATIRSKKELKIRLIYPGNLGTIIVKDKAELSTITDYEANELTLEVRDDAKIFMTARVSNFNLTMKSGTKGEINFKGDNAKVVLEDNANLKGILDYKEAAITMSSRTDARIDGDIKKAMITLDSRAEFNGSNLVVDDINLIIANNANAKVNAKNNLNLKSSNDARTALYNTPKIVIEEFTGSSVLSKK